MMAKRINGVTRSVLFSAILMATMCCWALGIQRHAPPSDAVTSARFNLTMAPRSLEGAAPELPRIFLNTDYRAPTRSPKFVAAGADLQAAINAAQPGDVITLQAGATWTG